jgi:hypothetical protein
LRRVQKREWNMRTGVPSNQIKAIAMAIAGAIVAAVAMMFVPAVLLEGFTGATGLSELIPAAAAPLGDTARAMIAFGAGAVTLALLAIILIRQDSAASAAEAGPDALDDDTHAESFKDRLLARIALPKMPWTKSEDDITELADLPKLRNGDSHPDAPARRPLSAHQDLPVLDLAEIAVPTPEAEEPMLVEADGIDVVPVVERDASETPHKVADLVAGVAPVMSGDIQPTLAEMVAQLEAAVAERQRQLAELEAVAAQLGAGQVARQVMNQPAQAEKLVEPVIMPRPPLEAVPTSVKDDDMDSALAAALATLHRMNGTDR